MVHVENRLCDLLKLLQGSIRAAGFTQTDVDERIGRRRGYLSHVFQQRVDLKLVDLLRALDALQIDPARFFRAAFGHTQKTRTHVEELVSLVSEIRRMTASQASDPSPWLGSAEGSTRRRKADEGMLEKVRDAVRKILAEGDAETLGEARRAKLSGS